ncbi:MAG TPA: DNA mismatch repair protein MutL, partial [Pricia sp.]|nr:DNA mismatch repair protein MutL [Pricia sp.]
KSPYLHHAVVAAFEGLIKSDTYPGYFLYLEVNPSSLDINIHPTKTEVKFDDEHTLYAMLRSSIKHSLGQFNVAPALDFEHDQNLETPYGYRNKSATPPRISVDAGFNPFRENSGGGMAVHPKKQRSGNWENLYIGLESKLGHDGNSSSVSYESDTITGSIFEDKKVVSETAATTFQIRRKYIVTTIKSGMLVIDQNRAHQRVLYERFLKNSTIKEAVSQQLLFPLTLSFSTSEIKVLQEIEDILVSVGFLFGEIQNETITVAGVPLLVAESEVGMVLDQLISDYQQEVSGESFSQTDLLSKTLAKTLSVKTGEVLDPESQLALVNDLFACKEAMTSPFNKPVYITITENDIDKKFI